MYLIVIILALLSEMAVMTQLQPFQVGSSIDADLSKFFTHLPISAMFSADIW